MQGSQGSLMLMAFVLGFWCVWSANRDPNTLMEGLTLTVVAIIAKALMEWSGVPDFTPVVLASWGVLYVFNVAALEIVTRFSTSMGVNMTLSVASAVGWFFLAQYIFSPDGVKTISGFVN